MGPKDAFLIALSIIRSGVLHQHILFVKGKIVAVSRPHDLSEHSSSSTLWQKPWIPPTDVCWTFAL